MAGIPVDLKGVAFDPRTTTLEEFLQLYVQEGRKKGRQLKDWGNKVRNNPVFKKYLNEPVTSIFDVGAEASDAASNLLADAQNAEETVGGKSSLQSQIRNIEDNVFPKLKAIAGKEKFDIGDFDTLSDKVERLKTRGNRVTNKFQFNPTMIGDLQNALIEHVKKNPADRPIANAILLNLETASRPSLMTGLLFTDHTENKVTPAAQQLGVQGADGLFIESTRQGAKDSTQSERPYRSPLSKRAVSIIQDQNQYNRTQPWANRADPNKVFQIEALDKNGKKIVRAIDSTDVTRVLKQLNVPGLVLEFGPKGGLKDSNKKITAQDLRKLGIQNMNTIGIPPKNQAMLLSRDIGDIAAQDIYIPGATFSNAAVMDINKHSNFMLGLLTQKLPGGTEAVKKGKVLSPSAFIFDGLETPVFEVYDEAQVADVPIKKPSIQKPTPVEIEPAETNTSSKLQSDDTAMSQGKGDLSSGLTPDETKQLEGLGIKKFLSLIPIIGAAYVAPESYRGAKKRVEEITGPGILPEIAGGAAFASEFTEIGAYSDMVDREGALPRILAAEQANIDELRQRGRDRVATKMMEQEAIQDSAMRLKPEAGRDFIPAPEVEEDNFLTMQP